MRYLLDTQVLLWLLCNHSRLKASTKATLSAPSNTVMLSVASAWEMEIKRGIGKLETPNNLPDLLRIQRITELPVRLTHIQQLTALPHIHRDPFDRMLVAQANAENLVLVTADKKIKAYSVRTLDP